MKTILSRPLTKRNGERKSRFYLCEVNDGVVNTLTFNQWKKLDQTNESYEPTKESFINSLLRQIDRFAVKVDFNIYSKKESPSFTQKVEWLLNNGCKYTKNGLLD